MIVVATEDFELYHGVVSELRDRGATFTTVRPGEPLPEAVRAVIVGDGDPRPDGRLVGDDGDGTDDDETAGNGGDGESDGGSVDGDDGRRKGGSGGGNGPDGPDGDGEDGSLAVVVGDPDRPARAVEAALAAVRAGGGRTVVGVDPGTDPGIAVLSGETVVAAYQVPLREAVDTVREAVADAADPVVRVGDGARLQGAQVVEELDDVRVELVDEAGTTPHLGAGARGSGDVLAAVNIARRSGEVVESRSVEPTAGELQAIKNRSRERSAGDRTIDEALARRVASGELTIDEALDKHGESD